MKLFTIKAIGIAGLLSCASVNLHATQCPLDGWSEGLGGDAKSKNIPITEPKNDCDFHEWSWETFVWATAPINGQPRFLSLPRLDALTNKNNIKPGLVLKVGTRSHSLAALSQEDTGAIVQADGNMLVAKNGYPIYASVHMNSSYLNTAKNNLLNDTNLTPPKNEYVANAGKELSDFKNPKYYFQPGAAVFKATWLRLKPNEAAPEGAFTTQAEVPVLTIKNAIVQPKLDANGKVITTTATVALVGMHVVGVTVNHPEFVWGTFEHQLNAPMMEDNTFKFDDHKADKDYTFYDKNIPFSQVNIPNTAPDPATKETPVLSFDESSQTFKPVSQVVQENRTGGEANEGGPTNIKNLNISATNWLKTQTNQKIFANYQLIGTVWQAPNSYSPSNKNWQSIDQQAAVGSRLLANSTAETYRQSPNRQAPGSTVDDNQHNCFSCHNPSSYSFSVGGQPPQFSPRLIGISHVLDTSSPVYDTPNQMPLCWNVSAGPIWNNGDAQGKCPTACGKTSTWNGQWVTTQAGKESVCGCCTQ